MAVFFRGLDEGDKYDRQYGDAYLYRRIASYLKGFRREVTIIVVGLAILSFIGSFQPVWFSAALDELELDPNSTVVLVLVAALVVTGILQYFINYMRRYLMSKVIGNVVASLRKDAFDAALQRDLAFYDKNKSGKIVSRITSDTQEFGDVAIIASDVVTQLISLVVLFFVLLSQSVFLTIVLIGTTPLTIGASMLFRRLARRATRYGSRAMANVNDNIQESVSGISVAKNFRREEFLYSEFSRVNTQSYQTNLARGFVLASVFPMLNLISGLAVSLVLMTGAQQVVFGAIGVGAWYLFLQGIDRFYFPILNLSTFWSQFQQALSSTERIFALIDTQNTVVQTANEPLTELKGKIEFDNVTFTYDDGTTVLKDFNLTIAPGESVAFVGHTGAGKSTIAKLITRFYEFQKGQIRIDGRDIRTLDLRDFRSRMGIVPQQPFLFSGTIMDNIRYSRPDATEAEVREVAYSIGGGEWLETLPEGLNSSVGERGVRLSMGQRQLVSLVRVLLQHPAIFILDEATASVDPFTESQIQEALDLILQQSTSILIAHRLSTVRSADRIIVLRDGEIIEQGNHESLMAQGGHYAELYDTYFRHQSLDYIENARSALASD
ncbi:MAG: putative multidrug resistance ABC transporter ATP-binding/permease protein YheH [Anaerolineae bacterium]|nr:putative multidrug resistance ABC transporter ATP-binding/permease protein YheH [Anaerolineae bacterium]